MSDPAILKNTFTEKAEAVSAVVKSIRTMEDALAYAVDLCQKKEACRLLISGCEEPLSENAETLCDTKQKKIMAAPDLTAPVFKKLDVLCRENSIDLLGSGLHRQLSGIDIGFTFADYGIAETGTLVIDSSSEEMRLATMISEIHVAVLPVSRIRPTAFDLETELEKMNKNTPGYTAFITGASRTADIERVLALGVHGPLEVHILLLEDA